VVQSRQLSEAAKEKLDEAWADAINELALPFNLLDHPSMRTAINTTADRVRALRPLGDLLDKAEARETESLKDVLTRLARQKKSGCIVLDGRKSISKLPMVNFLFHCADGTWLIECVDTTGVQK